MELIEALNPLADKLEEALTEFTNANPTLLGRRFTIETAAGTVIVNPDAPICPACGSANLEIVDDALPC